MSKHHERAKEIFGKYAAKDIVHFTNDGQAFFDENAANNHGKTLKDKTVIPVERHEVIAPVSEDDEPADEENSDTEGTKGKAKAKTKTKAADEAK